MTLDNDDYAANVALIYWLYLAGILLIFTAFFGVTQAVFRQKGAPAWLRSHYRLQVRTFWIGALYIFLALLMLPSGLGVLIYTLWMIWLIVRCAKGLALLKQSEPYPNPETWLV